MEKGEFKLDRTAFHAGTHEETEKYYSKNQPRSSYERLKAANYLNSVAFQFDLNNPPKMDRSAFSMGKHKF
ncbi:hypothetical protein DYBT9275_05013 [Dyadobacter sp. CECT 9275]|uniref:Uncharacterized protein n=1 Tax=Dyadobacter helix TaxID=2822344 RepID=A0A916JHR3_9BACT|nr:hypothetical protein [Dyadobacter sp. CECT 9275]CAG5011736.1 hypothetical protein DYBT9275_05013 [Dyadobacter sp. CECT 9275]